MVEGQGAPASRERLVVGGGWVPGLRGRRLQMRTLPATAFGTPHACMWYHMHALAVPHQLGIGQRVEGPAGDWPAARIVPPAHTPAHTPACLPEEVALHVRTPNGVVNMSANTWTEETPASPAPASSLTFCICFKVLDLLLSITALCNEWTDSRAAPLARFKVLLA